MDQSAHGMAVSSTDYVIYKLRTFEFDSHVCTLRYIVLSYYPYCEMAPK